MTEARRGCVEAAGVRLECAWSGPGPETAPTLVFLHEGLGCVSTWRDFPARLAEATGFGAFVYSRAGYGRSDPVGLPRPIDFMEREARAVLPEALRAAGIGRHVLVGHSDGASIALIFAATPAPARAGLLGLCLEAPHVFVEDVTIGSIAAIAERYRSDGGALRERLRRHHGINVDAAFRGWSRVWLDPRFRRWSIVGLLAAVAAPVLVVQGAGDEYGTLDQVTAIEKGAPGLVRTRLLDACGHAPHRDRTEAVLAEMADFVAGCSGGFAGPDGG